MRGQCNVRSEEWLHRDCEWIAKDHGNVNLSLVRSSSLNLVVLNGPFVTVVEGIRRDKMNQIMRMATRRLARPGPTDPVHSSRREIV